MEWWGNSALLVSGYDSDAQAYITAVEAADGQALEVAVTDAINAFVVGCKADGIWTAIRSSCILAGARTLAGALVPLVGPAPTNFNFTGARHNRKTGLLGDGATTYLLSNYDNSADPQNDKHIAVWQTEHFARNATRAVIGTGGVAGSSVLVATTTARFFRANHGGTVSDSNISDNTTVTGLWGASRNSATSLTGRYNSTNYTLNIASAAPAAGNIFVFSRGTNSEITNGRLSFYSIGRHLNLSVLEARIAGLTNTLAALSL
jgi:hypothetical protein